MKSLQDKYNLIKEGKGNKELFIKEARTLFPNVVTGALTFDQSIHNLTERGIISENFTAVLSQKEGEPNWFKIFNENTEKIKSDLKKTISLLRKKKLQDMITKIRKVITIFQPMNSYQVIMLR
jgi:hypothetical protein